MTTTIFTHPPDYPKAAVAARALARLGVRVFLAIDQKDPVPAIEGGEVVVTRFNRRGNLNGKECVQGIIDTLISHADDSPYQLKVDSDTLVRGLDWLEGRTEPAVGLKHESGNRRKFFGCCYALRTDRLEDFKREAEKLPDWDKNCPEDETISGLLPGRFGYENLTPGCPFAAYSDKKGLTEEQWRQFRVLVFQMLPNREIRDLMLRFS